MTDPIFNRVLFPLAWMLVGAGVMTGGYLLHERQVLKEIVEKGVGDPDYLGSRTCAFENGAHLERCTANVWIEAERLVSQAGELEGRWRFIAARRMYTKAWGMYEAMAWVCDSLGESEDAGDKSEAKRETSGRDPDVSECVQRGDMAMAEGNELDAVYWYHEAMGKGSAAAVVKKHVAERALGDATAEPCPAMIDNGICRAACSARLDGRLAEIISRLLGRYAEVPRFSIGDAEKLSPSELHRLACELAVVGNDVGIAYLNTRKLIDVNDTRGGGLVHYAAIAGQEQFVKWIVGVCSADANKVDDNGKTPCEWLAEELKSCDPTRSDVLRRIEQYLRQQSSR